MIFGVRWQDAIATAGGMPALLSPATSSEHGQQTALEFLRARAEGPAVVGAGDLPQGSVWGTGVNTLGVTNGDVAIDLAVNQQDRDFSGRY